MSKAEKCVRQLLVEAKIELNGSSPSDMQLYRNRAFNRALAKGHLGLGEDFMDGGWDAEALDEFFYRLLLRYD
ncbi:hypothetical protein ACYZT2_18775 [Pseudomonas sp. MDT1-85]